METNARNDSRFSPKKLSCAEQRFGPSSQSRQGHAIREGMQITEQQALHCLLKLPTSVTPSCKVPVPQAKNNSWGTDALHFFCNGVPSVEASHVPIQIQ
jgi:hypothetical protein